MGSSKRKSNIPADKDKVFNVSNVSFTNQKTRRMRVTKISSRIAQTLSIILHVTISFMLILKSIPGQLLLQTSAEGNDLMSQMNVSLSATIKARHEML
ncbi:hypothetical protein AVEN_178011-1 [Araneus ventricosus]|uniref:Transmembrane protein n=1 Tax=Araneus ventricosus TaxID=182803 RepID=A0A4Y2K5D1_ARAVE|nr:hypothetical protein AVEN_178011-1 [Araneus ventricosus]